MDLTNLLKKSHLGAGLDGDELAALGEITLSRTVHKNEIIFLEGDPAEGFFLLLSGKVRIYKASPDGREYTIHQIQPGQMFAEVAIFRGGHYPANCAAMEDSTIAFFPKDKFQQLLKKSPQISLKIIGSLSAFLRDYNRQVEALSLKEVPARIASFLLNEFEKSEKKTIVLDTSKTELARRLGTISETLSRNLKKLKELNIIRVRGKEITVTDPARLSDIADGEKI